MTREEAWNRIDAIIAKYEIDDEYVTITSILDYDALRLARKLLEQEHCEDAISRQAVLDQTYLWSKDEFLRVTNPFDYLRKRINSLPYVNPAEKVGHWIKTDEGFSPYKCSVCGSIEFKESNYCPNYDRKMKKTQTELGTDNDAALCDNCPYKTDTCQEGLHCPMDE